tara:strand:+ start:128 stop:652 length:525 start_codon:yes stop_codon:yes gene_type:complete
MHIFGCEDTTTVVMNYLTRKEIRPLLCINKDFYNIRNNGYYSIRVVQHFFKHKKIKCHENKHYCKKITLQDLYQDSDEYIGKSIQFILKPTNIGNQECIHNTMWECKFGGTTTPNNFNLTNKGILGIHIGHINHNIYSTCSCYYDCTKLDNENTLTYFTEKKFKIYPHSIRVIE